MKKAVLLSTLPLVEKALVIRTKLENKAKGILSTWKQNYRKALDATHFAEEASREQYDAVVVLEDRTVNEKLFQVLLREYVPKLGIIPGGTGNLILKLLKSIKTSMALLMRRF